MNFVSKAISLNIWGVIGLLFGFYLMFLAIKNPPQEQFKKVLLWFGIAFYFFISSMALYIFYYVEKHPNAF